MRNHIYSAFFSFPSQSFVLAAVFLCGGVVVLDVVEYRLGEIKEQEKTNRRYGSRGQMRRGPRRVRRSALYTSIY